LVRRFVLCYNQERLHSTIGYATPKDELERRGPVIFAERKRKLAAARKRMSLAHSQAEPRTPRQSGRIRLSEVEPCPL
jgi:hypothetical protein